MSSVTKVGVVVPSRSVVSDQVRICSVDLVRDVPLLRRAYSGNTSYCTDSPFSILSMANNAAISRSVLIRQRLTSFETKANDVGW